jgi:hypothetical protein
MSCHTVQKFISAYLDDSLHAEERDKMAWHLARCRECAIRSDEVHRLRTMLRSIPVAAPPPSLATRLRVLASHERARRLARLTISVRLQHWAGRLRLFTDNLMRPVALPFAGGLASALVLFSMLVPNLSFQFNFHNDVPIRAFYTEPSLIDTAPFNFTYTHDGAVVELTINSKGLVTDYYFPESQLDRNAENNLIANFVLFSSYRPATMFGQPTSGKLRFSIRRSRVDVRG